MTVNNEDRGASVQSGLSVRGVTVRYPSQGSDQPAAIADVSLDVWQGEIVALTGPSGCGKSTLLRAISGLEPLEAGTVEWNGENVTRLPPHRRGFGLMFQDGQLFAHMNVAKNIAYGLAAQKLPRHEREARAAQLLALVGLPEHGERSVTELSGGQRQRIALARSLAPKPKLLMLDEPLSSLDRGLRDRLASELAHLLRRAGTTAIVVTHDPQEAATIADRVLEMRDGRVIEE